MESGVQFNSRELAVRNQFFTPRYVVQFLTDNTLGRIWYEMRQGETRLGDLDYLVRRPNEVFLAEGQEPSAAADASDENLTQEELLQRPVHVPFRAKKDPRDIRVLDPACGSGHFLLYAFDLLLTIYEEAWADEASPPSDRTGRRLRDDYPQLEGLCAAAPGLILRHNLHGIDIDVRCAQIAALALWVRAQRAYMDLGISRDARPVIQKTNIVVAEPMPGEKELRDEFIASLSSQLGGLVQLIFDRMGIAGRAGALLSIEDDIHSGIRKAYGDSGELFRSPDEDRWRRAEIDLVDALQRYSDAIHNGKTYQRRLFAEDAAHSLGFINLCRQAYDVVLMNPPFGDYPSQLEKRFRAQFPGSFRDLYQMFVDRALKLTAPEGVIGALTNRTGFYLRRSRQWREALAGSGSIQEVLDLGLDVLDAAMVQVAAYTVTKRVGDGMPSVFMRLLKVPGPDKEARASLMLSRWRATESDSILYVRSLHGLAKLPGRTLGYWLSQSLISKLGSMSSLSDAGIEIRIGLQTSDDLRHVRNWWEVPADSDAWMPYAKGGAFSPYFDDINLVVFWRDEGHIYWATENKKLGKPHSNIWMLQETIGRFFGAGGLTYPLRTAKRLNPRLFPAGSAFGQKGPVIAWKSRQHELALLGLLNARIFEWIVTTQVGREGLDTRGAAMSYEAGILLDAPMPDLSPNDLERLATLGKQLAQLAQSRCLRDETTHQFIGLGGKLPQGELRAYAENELRNQEDADLNRMELESLAEKAVNDFYGLAPEDIREMEEGLSPRPTSYPVEAPQDLLNGFENAYLGRDSQRYRSDGAVEDIGARGRFHAEDIEGASHWFRIHPKTLVNARRARSLSPPGLLRQLAGRLWSIVFGVAIGRWTDDVLNPPNSTTSPPDLFEPLEISEMLVRNGAARFLVTDPGHACDVYTRVREVMEKAWGTSGAELYDEILAALSGSDGSRDQWVNKDFFQEHVLRYSKSRRKAPVYWQLSTSSGRYSIWLHHASLTKDSFYELLNDLAGPKLQHEERRHTSLAQEAGPNPSASQRKEIDAQERFVAELHAFRDEVARVAALWNPNLNDGVIINFAPLWRLVPHNRSWQKECKKVWDKLVDCDYDWAHLAMHLWPERVVPKCVKDRSLAIAHGLEEDLWYEDGDGKWQPRKWDQRTVDKITEERTSAAVKDALKKLLEAPAPAPASSRGSRRKKAPRHSGSRQAAPLGRKRPMAPRRRASVARPTARCSAR